VQQRLKATAGGRGDDQDRDPKTSPLAGKLFDETGDRLTPTHANKKGRRYRYYVSNRMIVGNGDTDKSKARADGGCRQSRWNSNLASAIQAHLRNRLPVDLLIDPSADDIRRIRDLLDEAASGNPAQSPEAFCPASSEPRSLRERSNSPSTAKPSLPGCLSHQKRSMPMRCHSRSRSSSASAVSRPN
jgi:site-specific DNA recombinase